MENKWTLNHMVWHPNRTEISYVCVYIYIICTIIFVGTYTYPYVSTFSVFWVMGLWIIFIYSFYLYCCILSITFIIWNEGFTKTHCSTNLMCENSRNVVFLSQMAPNLPTFWPIPSGPLATWPHGGWPFVHFSAFRWKAVKKDYFPPFEMY